MWDLRVKGLVSQPSQSISLLISLFCHAHPFTHLVTHLLKTNLLCIYDVAGTVLSTEDATLFNTCLTSYTLIFSPTLKYRRQGHSTVQWLFCINICFQFIWFSRHDTRLLAQWWLKYCCFPQNITVLNAGRE